MVIFIQKRKNFCGPVGDLRQRKENIKKKKGKRSNRKKLSNRLKLNVLFTVINKPKILGLGRSYTPINMYINISVKKDFSFKNKNKLINMPLYYFKPGLW